MFENQNEGVPGSTIHKFLLEKDKTTKNTMQQESLEYLLQFGCSKKNKMAVFEISTNFVAHLKGHKILKKYFKSTFETQYLNKIFGGQVA